jgi:two-component system response regulator DevR
MKSDPASLPLRILLVDDHAVVRVGLRNLIQDEPDLTVVGEATTCEQAVRMASEVDPDVILLDLRLPDGLGVDIIGDLKRSRPGTRVLVLTSFADSTLLLTALKAGADGYLLKDVAEADLIGAIHQVAESGSVAPQPGMGGADARIPPAHADALPTFERLTGQERKIFEWVGRGHSNAEVAKATGLSERTVRNYLSRVFEKLRLRSRSELVALYVSRGVWERNALHRKHGA